MKPWMKISLGCLAASVIALFLLVAGLVGLGYWAKNRVEEFTGGGPEVEAARQAANAAPFSTPAGNLVSEARLVRFIEVRAAVYSVYEKYREEIESRLAKVKEGKPVDFADISTGLTFMGEIQRAETLALAKYQMSEREYAFIAGEVYKSMWSDRAEGAKAMEGMASAARSAADAMAAAKGQEGALPPEAREALAKAREGMAEGVEDASRQLASIRTSPENEALFRKYEADLKKYAMPGLASLFDADAQGRKTPEAPSPPPR